MAAKKSIQRQGFKTGEHVVYPAHGVGQIVDIEQQEIAGFALELFVIDFAKDKMKLRVPVPKVTSVGMRKIAEAEEVAKIIENRSGQGSHQAHHVESSRSGNTMPRSIPAT